MKKRLLKKKTTSIIYKGLSPVKCTSCRSPIKKNQRSEKAVDGTYTCDVCKGMVFNGFMNL